MDATPLTSEPLSAATRRWLQFVARRALRDAMAQRDPSAHGLSVGTAERPDDARLSAPASVFVSWYDGAALVDTLGSVDAWLPLEQAVARYAVHAGLDPRVPVTRSRWHRLVCEISVLGAPQDLPVVGVDAIREALVPGRDGVILSVSPRQHAVALPSTWRSAPRPHDFLVALLRKAGLSPERDGARARARTFVTETFAEPVTDLRRPSTLADAGLTALSA